MAFRALPAIQTPRHVFEEKLAQSHDVIDVVYRSDRRLTLEISFREVFINAYHDLIATGATVEVEDCGCHWTIYATFPAPVLH